jgi:hypothetical protein
MAKRRYDYLERLEPKYCGWDPLPRRMMRKRILRKLVRDAVNNAWATIDATCEDAADRIAKELVP